MAANGRQSGSEGLLFVGALAWLVVSQLQVTLSALLVTWAFTLLFRNSGFLLLFALILIYCTASVLRDGPSPFLMFPLNPFLEIFYPKRLSVFS